MTNEITKLHPQKTPESFSSIIGGLLGDLQKLIRQEVQTIRNDLKKDISENIKTVQLIVSGPLVTLIGWLWVSLGVVHLLHEVVLLSMWKSYGSVGMGLLVIGSYITYRGRMKNELVNENTNRDMRDTG